MEGNTQMANNITHAKEHDGEPIIKTSAELEREIKELNEKIRA